MRIFPIAVVWFVFAVALMADSKQQPVAATTSAPTANHPQPEPTTGGASDQQSVEELTHRVRKLELEALQKSQPKDNSGIIAALLVGSLALVGQTFLAFREDRRASRAAEHAVELAKEEALLRQQEKLLEFRLKQMEMFYAPMRALLSQSKGLRDKMRLQLIQDEPARYRLKSPRDPDGHDYEVCLEDKTWHDFRLLDQFPLVKQNPKALALADRILSIGKQMTEIISTNAGLATGDLLDLLGQYMCHYAILSAIREEDRTEPYPPGSHKLGYYPRELDDRIASGYRDLAQKITDSAQGSSNLANVKSNTSGKKE